MKLQDILVEEVSYKVFCDLDGVLVDFMTTAIDITGINIEKTDDKKSVNKFWSLIAKHTAEGKPFFGKMAPLPDAHTLWDYISRHDPVILSSTGERIANAVSEKTDWVQRHLGSDAAKTAIFTPSAKAKAKFAAPNHILIDDRDKAIQPWVAAGGIGILHTSAANTIKQLKDLGI